MENTSFLQGGLENLKLISDDVWNTFDYDSEFKDVFANISRRESLISHRFYSVSSADILSDLQYTIRPTTEDCLPTTPSVSNPCFEHIFDGEIFQLRDENNGTECYENLNNGENQIENAYWDDVRTVGCGRQQTGVNVTYNNAFDPRLTFSGLVQEPCFLDDLGNDNNVQQNVCMNVEDVADIVDEYYNQYHAFLKDLDCNRKERKKYIEKILSNQPPKTSASPKAFDLKTCWKNEEERKLAKQLDSNRIRKIWSQTSPGINPENIYYGNKPKDDKSNESFTEVTAMTPSPHHADSLRRRTPGRHEDNRVSNETQARKMSEEISSASCNLWTEAWRFDKSSNPLLNPTMRSQECQPENGGNSLQSEDCIQWEKFIEKRGMKKPTVKFDLEIVDGNVRILTRTTEDAADYKLEKPHQDYYSIKHHKDPKRRSTSKASSDTRVFIDEERSIPVLTSSRQQNKDRAKSMRSESSLTTVETCMMGYQKKSKSPQPSPRETSQSSFVEGSFQTVPGDVCPTRGKSEIFPQFPPDAHHQKQREFYRFSENTQGDKVDTRTPKLFQTVREDGYLQDDDIYPTDSKFYNTLKQYGWYDENYDNKQPPENYDNKQPPENYDNKQPPGEKLDNAGVSWSYSLGNICDIKPSPQPSMKAPCYTSTSKRQLLKSPSPDKRYDGNSSENWEVSSRKTFDSLPRSSSVSPVKRHALHNASFSSQLSSPNMESPLSSVIMDSPEPEKTSSQLNAACEPFIPAHLQSKESSPVKPAIQQVSSKQDDCQIPNKEMLKKLLQSPEFIVPMVASNDARQAFLIQQKQHQIQMQPTQSPYQQLKAAKGAVLQPQSQSNVTRREAVVTSARSNIGVFSHNPQHPRISFSPQHLQLPHPPPFVRPNTLIPQWPCPTSAPPGSRPFTLAFQDPRTRTMPLPQQYAPPLITWQAFPSYPPHPRLFRHPLFNLNNNCTDCDEHGYGPMSSDSFAPYTDHMDSEAMEAPVPSVRGARPIRARANQANLIHISTK